MTAKKRSPAEQQRYAKALEAAAFTLYSKWYAGSYVPMPHWSALPLESRAAVAAIVQEVLQTYSREIRFGPVHHDDKT